MDHNILPKDCVRIPGKKLSYFGDYDTGKDFIVTKWIYDKMSPYFLSKSKISDLIIGLLFEDRKMTLRRRLADHWDFPSRFTEEFFTAIEYGDPYSYSRHCKTADEYKYVRLTLLAETLKWKVISRNPKYDNFSTFYANDEDGLTRSIVVFEEYDEEESNDEEDIRIPDLDNFIFPLRSYIPHSVCKRPIDLSRNQFAVLQDEDSDDEDSDDEECYGVEHKFCFFSKNYYTNRILETSGIRKIVYSIMSKECEETIPYWANLVFRRRTKGPLARSEESMRMEREME